MSIAFDDIDAINSYSSKEYGDWGRSVKNAVNYGCGGARFLSPVPAGSTVHARSRLLGAQSHRAGTLLSFESATHVLGNDKPALVYTSQILYQG